MSLIPLRPGKPNHTHVIHSESTRSAVWLAKRPARLRQRRIRRAVPWLLAVTVGVIAGFWIPNGGVWLAGLGVVTWIVCAVWSSY